MAGTISLYLRDDTLRKLDAEVARAAADDRAHGLTGRQVTNRSKFIERIIEDHLDTSTLPSKQDIRYHVASLSEQYGAAKVSLFGSYARGEANEDSDIDILLEKGDIKGLPGARLPRRPGPPARPTRRRRDHRRRKRTLPCEDPPRRGGAL